MNIPASAADVKQIFTAVDNMPNRITNYRKMHRAEREALMEEMLNLISILTVRYEDIGNCAPEIERKGLPAHEYHASITTAASDLEQNHPGIFAIAPTFL